MCALIPMLLHINICIEVLIDIASSLVLQIENACSSCHLIK